MLVIEINLMLVKYIYGKYGFSLIFQFIQLLLVFLQNVAVVISLCYVRIMLATC